MGLWGKKSSNEPEVIEEEEYYVYPVLEDADYRVHTPEHPFCDDMTCPCHEDEENVGELGQQYQDGLVSSGDADRIYRGKTL